jgi:hypothetical protein
VLVYWRTTRKLLMLMQGGSSPPVSAVKNL